MVNVDKYPILSTQIDFLFSLVFNSTHKRVSIHNSCMRNEGANNEKFKSIEDRYAMLK